MKKTLEEIAEIIGGEIANESDKSIEIRGLENISGARSGDLTFAVEPHIEEAKSTRASAVILPLDVKDFPIPSIRAEDPRAAIAKLLEIFTPKLQIPEGVSPQASIGKNVKLGRDVSILPFAVIDDNATIGDRVTIFPHAYIGQFAEVDSDSRIYPSVTIREHCRIGKRCVIHANTVIGSDGFGFTTKDGIHTKVPQVGNVVVEDDVEIGSHVGIDRAAMGSTVIGHGTKIDNLVHIGHNCKIGANCLIVAQTGISGSVTVGDNVTFGGQVGTVGHISIGSNSIFAARSGITHNMPDGYFGAGFPVQTHAEWLKNQVALKHLPDIMKKIKRLEKLLEEKS